MGLPGMLWIFAGGADTAVLLACLALAAATMLFVFWVHYEPADFARLRSRLDELMDRRDTIYDNLRDLKFEHRAGKYAPKDYEEMKAAMENEAALVLSELDQESAREVARNPGTPRKRAPAGGGEA
ncbi:MAG TPA: hypothetical protein VEH49_08180 [Methylomirabilota bacterium]|nr:hypothetical protein [Methylomirabilota bacterium]